MRSYPSRHAFHTEMKRKIGIRLGSFRARPHSSEESSIRIKYRLFSMIAKQISNLQGFAVNHHLESRKSKRSIVILVKKWIFGSRPLAKGNLPAKPSVAPLWGCC